MSNDPPFRKIKETYNTLTAFARTIAASQMAPDVSESLAARNRRRWTERQMWEKQERKKREERQKNNPFTHPAPALVPATEDDFIHEHTPSTDGADSQAEEESELPSFGTRKAHEHTLGSTEPVIKLSTPDTVASKETAEWYKARQDTVDENGNVRSGLVHKPRLTKSGRGRKRRVYFADESPLKLSKVEQPKSPMEAPSPSMIGDEDEDADVDYFALEGEDQSDGEAESESIQGEGDQSDEDQSEEVQTSEGQEEGEQDGKDAAEEEQSQNDDGEKKDEAQETANEGEDNTESKEDAENASKNTTEPAEEGIERGRTTFRTARRENDPVDDSDSWKRRGRSPGPRKPEPSSLRGGGSEEIEHTKVEQKDADVGLTKQEVKVEKPATSTGIFEDVEAERNETDRGFGEWVEATGDVSDK